VIGELMDQLLWLRIDTREGVQELVDCSAVRFPASQRRSATIRALMNYHERTSRDPHVAGREPVFKRARE
jgi:hypothetical protein